MFIVLTVLKKEILYLMGNYNPYENFLKTLNKAADYISLPDEYLYLINI